MYVWLLCRCPKSKASRELSLIARLAGFEFLDHRIIPSLFEVRKIVPRVDFSTPCCFMCLPIEGFGHVFSWWYKGTFNNSLTLHWFIFHFRLLTTWNLTIMVGFGFVYLFSKHHVKTLYHQLHLSFVVFVENIMYMNCLFLNENFVTMNFKSMIGYLPRMHY